MDLLSDNNNTNNTHTKSNRNTSDSSQLLQQFTQYSDFLQYVVDIQSNGNAEAQQRNHTLTQENLSDFFAKRVASFNNKPHSPSIEQNEISTNKGTGTKNSDNNNSNVIKREGIIGPNRDVALVKQSAVGGFLFSEDQLEVEALGHFSSIRANVCVFKGKWMYEITLGTAGVQQIGWATLDSPFNQEVGVGDSPDSYSYDGKRVKKWNAACTNYGQSWTVGDIIGCCLDLEKGQITFYRNGVSLGVAFSNIRCGENSISSAYFPAASLSYAERSRFNFGRTPFSHPVDEYQPLQSPPSSESMEQVNYLFECINRVLFVAKELANGTVSPIITKEDVLIVLASIFEYLAPKLQDDYIIASILYPFLETILIFEDETVLPLVLQFMVLCLEPAELDSILQSLFSYVSLKTRTTSTLSSSINNNPKLIYSSLRLLNALLAVPQIMERFVKASSFSTMMEALLTSKTLSSNDFSQQIPVVWWPNTEEEICSKEKMEASTNELQFCLSTHEDLMYALCNRFFTGFPSVPSSSVVSRDSLRQKFRSWVRSILEKNKGATRNVVPHGLSDPTVLTNLYFILLRHLQDLFTSTKEITSFPTIMFDKMLDYFDLNRVGGALTHLQKSLPINPDNNNAVPTQDEQVPLELELVDDLMVLYHLGMSTSFKQAIAYSQNLTQAISQLDDTNKRIKRAQEQRQQGVDHLILAKKVFLDDVVISVRHFIWYKLTLYASWKQEMMYTCISYLVKVLSYLAQFNPIFSYVPECYVETVIDSFHALRRGDPPFIFIEDSRLPGLVQVINFLINRFNDKRIVNPDIRDLLLQSLSVLLQYKDYVKIIETEDIDRYQMMKSLLGAFDSRLWMTILNILLRFWRGYGFAQGAKKKNDSSSIIFQKIFQEVATIDNTLLNEFINKIFNNLNWAITEFGVAAGELQQASRHFAAELQQNQRKCNVMFELSVSLIRISFFHLQHLYVLGNTLILINLHNVGVVIANKVDLDDRTVIKSHQGQQFASNHGLEFFECSALRGAEDVEAPFNWIAKTIHGYYESLVKVYASIHP